MLSKPATLHFFLSHHGLVDDIYAAMTKDDKSEMVLTALEILKKTNNIPALIKVEKSELKSTTYRNEGNTAYAAGKYQKALELYNKALLHAPKESRAMKLAYSNRSALLLKVKAFSDCLRDIETCFSMNCPEDIVDKLKKRKEETCGLMWMERLAESARYTTFSDEFFQLYSRRNPQIPCASTDVGVIVEDQIPKIVATTDIKVGTVLAVETAFVSQTTPRNFYSSCYHCQKFSFTLKPCDSCCFALFCSEECMKTSMYENHGIECKFMEIFEILTPSALSLLAIKTALKIRKMSKNWKEVVTASYDLGVDRVKNSSINDIFDGDKKFSLLSFKDDKHFVHGLMYNSCFACAVVIHYLDSVKSFFPQSPDEKNDAIRAMARILMFLTVYGPHMHSTPAVSIAVPDKTEFHGYANFGWFSFVGKLRNSCNPNMIVASLNKSVALIALQPIKRGTELTISYLGHYLDNLFIKEVRQKNMFILYGIACNCFVCSGEWEMNDRCQLTDIQKKNLGKLNLAEMRERFNPREISEMYPKLCKSLAFLNDVPYSKEYKDVYVMFRRCILFLQDIKTDNSLMDYIN